MQAILSVETNINRLKAKYGQVDVLLLRHITEHSPNCSRLLKSLSTLVAPGGYMMLELPDSQRLFNAGNYLSYGKSTLVFTESSARRLAQEVDASSMARALLLPL